MSPYGGQNFFSFFLVLGERACTFFTGGLFADEVQCLVLILLACSLAFLGMFLVVRQMTMLANALSHTLLVGIVIAALLLRCMQENSIVLDEMLPQGALWLAAGVTGVLTTFLTQKLIDRFRLPQDASIALVFTTLFALGILLVTLFTKNMHLGVEAVMGNVDALGPADVRSAWSFFLIVLCLFSLGFRSLKLSSFDPLFARSLGVPLTSINYGLMILTAGGALVAFRAVGVLLFLALLVGPVLWARLFAYTLKKILLLSMLFGVVCSLVAVGLSRHILTVYRMPVSTSGVLVTVLFLAYLLALMVHTKEKKKNFFSQDTEQRVSDFERSQTTNLE